MEFLVGGMFIFLVIAGIIGFISAILLITARWNLFKKAGYEGWESLVPFYSDYVMCDMVFGKGLYCLILAVPSVIAFIQGFSESESDEITTFLTLIASIFSIVMYYKLAKVFNKSSAFGVGLIFLTPIFIMILAFDHTAYYCGPSLKAPVRMGVNYGNAGSYGNSGGYGNSGSYGGGYNDYPMYGSNDSKGYPNNGYNQQNFSQQQDYQTYQSNGYQNNGFQNNGFQAQGQPLNNPFEQPNNENYYGNNSDYNNYNNQNGGNNDGGF